jgi:hypothetical protein
MPTPTRNKYFKKSKVPKSGKILETLGHFPETYLLSGSGTQGVSIGIVYLGSTKNEKSNMKIAKGSV